MRGPSGKTVHKAVVASIEQEHGEVGVYRVELVFDDVHEVFVIELNRPERSFGIRDDNRWRIFEDYAMSCRSMKFISRFVKDWHKGQHRSLPFDLAQFFTDR